MIRWLAIGYIRYIWNGEGALPQWVQDTIRRDPMMHRYWQNWNEVDLQLTQSASRWADQVQVELHAEGSKPAVARPAEDRSPRQHQPQSSKRFDWNPSSSVRWSFAMVCVLSLVVIGVLWVPKNGSVSNAGRMAAVGTSTSGSTDQSPSGPASVPPELAAQVIRSEWIAIRTTQTATEHLFNRFADSAKRLEGSLKPTSTSQSDSSVASVWSHGVRVSGSFLSNWDQGIDAEEQRLLNDIRSGASYFTETLPNRFLSLARRRN